MDKQPIELLAPARDLACGLAAIDCGADAVYIGAPRFSARAAAANPLRDIEKLAGHAHRYWARVYGALNTILTDAEIPLALRMAWQLYEAGVDGLIIQDMGLLEGDLPPLPLIASTQMHNATPGKVAFLERVGFSRAILARELDLDQIRAIRAETSIELEAFVHGALCVSYSGQCYLSYALGGRSGNRGDCAQPCRRPYSLIDGAGRRLVHDRFLLSLRDLNLSDSLTALLQAGITSFKVEGRLKNEGYVKNIVTFYRRRLDQALLEGGPWRKSSSGASQPGFTPDVSKTFNRGYTTYFLRGRGEPPGAMDTPKMVGEALGRVEAVGKASFVLEGPSVISPGDGICFFDEGRVLWGTRVNAVRGREVVPQRMEGIAKGRIIHRNHDHCFAEALGRARPERRLLVRLTMGQGPEGIILVAMDEDGNRGMASWLGAVEEAHKPDRMAETIRAQLSRMGGTAFALAGLDMAWTRTPFVPQSALNGLRREALARLAEDRSRNRPRGAGGQISNDAPYPERELGYEGNVLNAMAQAFYRRHGVKSIAPAAEAGLDLAGQRVMLTRHCLLHQMGWCPPRRPRDPLFLIDEEGRQYRLRFDCSACRMEVYLGEPPS